MASSNQTPDVLFSPIAANAASADINTIPQTYDPENYGYAAQNIGFPTECRLPIKNPDGTLGQGRAPRMQDWNGIMKLVSSHNFFLQNGGSYTFNPTVSSNLGGYPKNAVLWYFPENEDPCLVYSLINDNTNNFVNDPTLIDGEHWKKLSLGGGGGGEIGDMGFAPLGIDETQNLRRYLNGQVISQAQFVSFTTKVKSAVALFPSLATTEANWQSEKALSKFGQVGKFVIDDDAGTIRLPAVVNAQGLLSLSGIGSLVNESLPNITGSLSLGGDTGFYSNAYMNGVFTLNTSGSYTTVPSTTAPAGYPVSFSASSSSSTYQDGAPVQQEAIQYPYYIQVATGVEETLPAIREYEINTPFFFGQSMYSENAPYNASWLASNGHYNASTLYPDFWTQLTGVELNGSLNVGDTIEISGKTYVKRGLPVVLSTDTITDYDFVVNTADSTFRLPLLNGEEDLPGTTYEDLTLEASGSTYTAQANGILVLTKETASSADKLVWLRNSTTGYSQMSHTALTGNTLSASIELKKGQTGQYLYTADGATVVFRFIYAVGNGSLYFYVGDTVQDASLINAGAVLGQLANKADIDLSNVNNINNAAASNLNSKGIRTVIETFHTGTEWYRVWSDGWIEQGGSVTSNSGLIEYNFIIPFNDTNYGLLCSQNSGGMGPQSNGMIINRVSNTKFSVLFTENSTGLVYTWRACGY